MKFTLKINEEQKNSIDEVITRVPKNEYEVIRLFSKLEDVLGFKDVRLYIEYPDASAVLNGVEIDIEFEVLSSNFRQHKHNEDICSLIICWENDRDDFRIPVLELSTLSKNWKQAKEEALREYWSFVMKKMSWVGNNEDWTDNEQQRARYLMDIFNFTHVDAMSYFSGLSKTTLKSYAEYVPKFPECAGGPLTCVKRDLDPKHLKNEEVNQRLVPVVLCLECENKPNCVMGKATELGFYFIFEYPEYQPMKTKFINKEIKEKALLSHLQDLGLNIWKDRRFKRR